MQDISNVCVAGAPQTGRIPDWHLDRSISGRHWWVSRAGRYTRGTELYLTRISSGTVRSVGQVSGIGSLENPRKA